MPRVSTVRTVHVTLLCRRSGDTITPTTPRVGPAHRANHAADSVASVASAADALEKVGQDVAQIVGGLMAEAGAGAIRSRRHTLRRRWRRLTNRLRPAG